MNKKTKQEKIIEMLNNFINLSLEDQAYITGIVKGIDLSKNSSRKVIV